MELFEVPPVPCLNSHRWLYESYTSLLLLGHPALIPGGPTSHQPRVMEIIQFQDTLFAQLETLTLCEPTYGVIL